MSDNRIARRRALLQQREYLTAAMRASLADVLGSLRTFRQRDYFDFNDLIPGAKLS